MFKTKQSLTAILPLLCLGLFPYSAIAQTSESEPLRSNVPSAAERIGVQEVGIQDFVFDKPQPRQLPEISVQRELEVKFVPPLMDRIRCITILKGYRFKSDPSQPSQKPKILNNKLQKSPSLDEGLFY
ncbi:MAG: hypothetical protein WA902_04155 [Thermosynechococcaceae cyanobacterium]